MVRTLEPRHESKGIVSCSFFCRKKEPKSHPPRRTNSPPPALRFTNRSVQGFPICLLARFLLRQKSRAPPSPPWPPVPSRNIEEEIPPLLERRTGGRRGVRGEVKFPSSPSPQTSAQMSLLLFRELHEGVRPRRLSYRGKRKRSEFFLDLLFRASLP